MQYDQKTIEEKFKNLPDEVQLALMSPDTADTIKKIIVKYGLKLDQETSLFEQITYTLLNLIPSGDFVRSFSRESGVDFAVATKVAQDVNTEVFDKIKKAMEESAHVQELINSKDETDSTDSANMSDRDVEKELSNIEKAGDFEIIDDKKTTGSFDPKTRVETSDPQLELESPTEDKKDVTPIDTNITNKKGVDYSDPLVDHLLSNTLAIPEQKVVKTATVNTTPIPKGKDMYKEPVE